MKTALKTEILIIIFLWMNIIVSFINLPRAEIFMVAGIIGLTIVTVLFKPNNELSIFILTILLGLGIINLISFNDSIQVNFMGFINIVNFLLFIILVYKKWDTLSSLNEKWFGTPKEVFMERRKNQIQFFKHRFRDLSDDKLKDKLNEEIVDEAKKAIQEILQERK